MFQRYYSPSIYDVEILEGMNETYVDRLHIKLIQIKYFSWNMLRIICLVFLQVYRVLIAINETSNHDTISNC